jgi:hypothetical protein
MVRILTRRENLVIFICLAVNKFAYNLFYYGIQGSL